MMCWPPPPDESPGGAHHSTSPAETSPAAHTRARLVGLNEHNGGMTLSLRSTLGHLLLCAGSALASLGCDSATDDYVPLDAAPVLDVQDAASDGHVQSEASDATSTAGTVGQKCSSNADCGPGVTCLLSVGVALG